MFQKMFLFLQDAGNYESRMVGRTEVSGLIVSTCFTSDCGYETAILDKVGAHPVERYTTKEDSLIGHSKWCEIAKTAKTIVELAWFDEVNELGDIKPEIIKLKRDNIKSKELKIVNN